MLFHATSISIEGRGVLLTGAPGMGKSDLALQLIEKGAKLVSDDQTLLRRDKDSLFASSPPSIKGIIEIRHVGLMQLPYEKEVPVALMVELVSLETTLERLPDEDRVFLLDYSVPRLRLPAFAASTATKIKSFLSYPMIDDTSIAHSFG